MKQVGILAIAMTLLIGCGSGGGGTRLFPLATRLRPLQSGDQWTYDITGAGSVQGTQFTLTGTLTRSIAQTQLNGQNVLARLHVFTLRFSDGSNTSSTERAYFAQNPATGDVTLLADEGGVNNAVRNASGSPVILPGEWKIKGASARIQYDDASVDEWAWNITRSQASASPLGSFQTWQFDTSSDDTQNGVTEATFHYAPQTSSYIRATISHTESNLSLAMNLVLKQTNVPIQ